MRQRLRLFMGREEGVSIPIAVFNQFYIFNFISSSRKLHGLLSFVHIDLQMFYLYHIAEEHLKYYFTQSLIKTRGCVIILNQSHLDKFTLRKSAKLVSNPYFSYGETLEVHTPHQD